jgi:hypothetical protein
MRSKQAMLKSWGVLRQQILQKRLLPLMTVELAP